MQSREISPSFSCVLTSGIWTLSTRNKDANEGPQWRHGFLFYDIHYVAKTSHSLFSFFFLYIALNQLPQWPCLPQGGKDPTILENREILTTSCDPLWAIALATVGGKTPHLTTWNIWQNQGQGGVAICCDWVGMRGGTQAKDTVWKRTRDYK